MIICKKHNFIFLRTAKTGSGTLTHALEAGSGCTRREPTHATAATVQEMIGKEAMDKMFTFAFVRNPWDRLYSSYCWRKWNKGIVKEGESFNLWLIGVRNKESLHIVGSQYENLLDKDGNKIVQFVGRYENLEADYRKVCKRINIQPKRLGHYNAAKGKIKHYSEMYDDEALEIANEILKVDIEHLGYKYKVKHGKK